MRLRLTLITGVVATLLALGAGAAGARTSGGLHPLQPLHFATTSAQSTNWFGYNQGILDTGSPGTSVSGTWTVPTASQHRSGQAENSAVWVGIGGGCLSTPGCLATDATLIQAGTEQDVDANGAASYSAWYEIIPAPAISVTNLKVSPGDSVTVAITQTAPGLWSIQMTDNSQPGDTFSTTVPYSSDFTTVEWITEAPLVFGTAGAGQAAMPNLTPVRFTSAAVNGRNANLQASQKVEMIDANNAVIGTPSDPVGGSAFNDCAWASTCAAP